MPNVNINRRVVLSGQVRYGDYTTAWYAQVLANGGTATATELAALTVFETAVGSDMAEFDRLWIHGVSNSVAARVSFVNPTSTLITNVNSTTFTAGQGYTGNGSTMYLNTNYNMSSSSVKYTLNSACSFQYSTLNIDENSRAYGANDGTMFSQSILRLANQKYLSINSAAVFATPANANSLGLHCDLRTGAANVSFYKNGGLVSTVAQASTGLPNTNVFLLARSDSGVANFYSTNRIAATGFSSGAINQSNFYTSLQALGGSLGWSV